MNAASSAGRIVNSRDPLPARHRMVGESRDVNADELAICCADIGWIKNDNFGRAVVHGEEERGGKEIGELVADVVVSLSDLGGG